MNETKHTPGPWKTSYTNISVVTAENGAVIARASKLNGLMNLQANARLIAAAPDLLEALQTVVANAPEPYCAITRAIDAQCRAAIAKATGEPK